MSVACPVVYGAAGRDRPVAVVLPPLNRWSISRFTPRALAGARGSDW